MVRYLSQGELDEIKTRQNDIATNLIKLQEQELELYERLQSNVTNENGEDVSRENMIAKINTLSRTRMDMYKDLMENYKLIENNVSQSKESLVDQLAIIDMVQQQLDSYKKQTAELKSMKNNKARMVEINNYYGQKYMAQKELMQLIILTCIPLLILALLSKVGTIGSQLASVIGGIVLIIGIYFIGKKVLDIMSRSKLVFNEYDWGYHPSPPPVTNELGDMSQQNNLNTKDFGTCYGQNCCSDGTIFSDTLFKCVPANIEEDINTTQTETQSIDNISMDSINEQISNIQNN